MKTRTAILLTRMDAIACFFVAFLFCGYAYLMLPSLFFLDAGSGWFVLSIVLGTVIPGVLLVLCGIALLRLRHRVLLIVMHAFGAFSSAALGLLLAGAASTTYGGGADIGSVLAMILLFVLFLWNSFFVYALAFDVAFKNLFAAGTESSIADAASVERADAVVRQEEHSDRRLGRILLLGKVLAFFNVVLSVFLVQATIILGAVVSPNTTNEIIIVTSIILLAIVAFISSGSFVLLLLLSSKRIVLIRLSLAVFTACWSTMFVIMFSVLANIVSEEPLVGLLAIVVVLSVEVLNVYWLIVSFGGPMTSFIASERTPPSPK